jgi:hypothetical protein
LYWRGETAFFTFSVARSTAAQQLKQLLPAKESEIRSLLSSAAAIYRLVNPLVERTCNLRNFQVTIF